MKVARNRQIGAFAAFLIVVSVLWWQVFAMTGILWWEAPRATDRPVPPPAVHFREVPTSWVDLPAYHKLHPMWPIDAP